MKDVTSQILAEIHETDAESITISMVQSIVEQKLIANGYLKIAERYIAYRLQRDIDRYFNPDTMLVHLHFEKTSIIEHDTVLTLCLLICLILV